MAANVWYEDPNVKPIKHISLIHLHLNDGLMQKSAGFHWSQIHAVDSKIPCVTLTLALSLGRRGWGMRVRQSLAKG